MRVIFALDTPVVPEKSTFLIGSVEDEYRFMRKWCVPIRPNLEMEEDDQLSEWTVVSKILTGVSWNMRFDLELKRKKASEESFHGANICLPNTVGFVKLDDFLHMFGKTMKDTKIPATVLKIQIDDLTCIRFKDYYVSGDGYPVDFNKVDKCLDEKLTDPETLKLLMADDKDVRVTWEESFKTPVADSVSVCERILGTGYFSDCQLVSNEGADSPCHKVILKETCAKFAAEIASGNTKIKLDLSTSGVAAFLRFVYCGVLNDAKSDWELALELLKIASSYDVPKLWTAIVEILSQIDDMNMETAAAGLQLLVKSGKLETAKDLARKLVSFINTRATQTAGDRVILHEYIKDKAFFDAWTDFVLMSIRVGPTTGCED